jgi:paraquat-inducible protein B
VLTGGKGTEAVDLVNLSARGLRAELNIQSFVTGQSEIDLDFDSASPSVMHPGVTRLPEIPTRQSTIQKMQEQLSRLPLRELTDNANATLRSLRTLSKKLDNALPPLIDNLRATSDRSAVAIAAAGQAVTEIQGRLDATLGDISRLAKAGTVQLQAREILADLKGVTSERGTDRANIDSALRDLATTAAALRGLATDVERNPQLLLTGRRP